MAAEKERDPGLASAEIKKYLDILAKDPSSRVFAPLAEAYRKAGLCEDAVEIAREGLRTHPNYLGGRVALGRACFELKKYDEAAAEMQQVVKAAPDNIIAHKVLGQIAYSKDDLPAAEKAFKMVLMLDPRDQEAQQFIAKLSGSSSAPRAQAPAFVPPPPAAPEPLTIPPPPAPPPPAAAVEPLPFDEIQELGDLDLTTADIFGESAQKEPPVVRLTPDLPPPPAPPTMRLSEPLSSPPTPPLEMPEEFGMDEPLDFGGSDSWLPEAAPAPEPASTRVPVSAPVLTPAPAVSSGPMELEVFSRVPWGGGNESAVDTEVAPPPEPPAQGTASVVAETPAATAAAPEESPFEVFGRPMRSGPPQSTKGEQTAFGEIDLESAALEVAESEPEPESDSPFEIFTRQPGVSAPPQPAKVVRPGERGPRELDVETTAYTLDETIGSDGADTMLLSLDDEMPNIDLSQEVDFGSPEEPVTPAIEPWPEAGIEPVLEPEFETGFEFEPEVEPESGVGAPLEVVPPVEPDYGIDLDLDQDLDLQPEVSVGSGAATPRVAPAQATPSGPSSEEDEEDLPDEGPGEAQASRGVFDTETLAAIYTNQGFYGRAAEIYQRLIAERPGDAQLRGKLDAVLALERAEMGIEEPAAPAAAAPEPAFAAPAPVRSAPVRPVPVMTAPVITAPAMTASAPRVPSPAPAPSSKPAGPEKMIGQLQTLLETFKGGRPR